MAETHPQPPDSDREALVVHAFLERVAADQDGAGVRPLADYQAEQPGHDELIAREYQALFGEREADGDALVAVGAYRVVEELGRGAQGIVYRARDESLGREVALKVLRRTFAEDARAALRFRREARATAQLHHPGICTVYDSGVDGGAAYIAMRLVDGETLAEQIARRAAPPARREDIDRVAALFERGARALQAAHAAGVAHRDLKPGNIMITADGQPVLCDFGLAAVADGEAARLTMTGERFGTPAYMAPERLIGTEVEGDARAGDVYALGVCLYEALTGRRPFEAATLDALYTAVRDGQATDVREHNAAVPPDLAVVVATAIEPAAERRYRSADALAEDLGRVLRREPVQARPAPAWLRLRRFGERNPVLATALAGLFLVITAALVITSVLLEQARDREIRLSQALADAKIGRLTKRQQEVEDLLIRGFQIGFGVETARARPLFDRALELDPGNPTALAGVALLRMPDAEAALAALRAAGGEGLDDPDLAGLQGWLAATVAGAEAAPWADSGTDLGAFLGGHVAVRGFTPPVDAEAARRALASFRVAAMRAWRPRFHHYHSWMMAAHHADDVPAMREADAALRHHWPDAQATWEAVAQFWFQRDPERAREALRHILELGPSVSAHLGLGAWAMAHGRPDEALAEFDLAVEMAPELPAAYLMRAGLLARLERRRDAARDYVFALGEPLSDAMVVAALAQLLEEIGDDEFAREIVADIHARAPEIVESLPDRLARLVPKRP